MGSSSSKAAKTAAGAAQRQYPLRPSPGTRETQQAPQPATRQEDLQPREAEQARAQAQSRHGLRGEAPAEGRTQCKFSRSSSCVVPSRTASTDIPLHSHQPTNLFRIAIDLDGRDPQLANALRQIGPVQPNPTYSPSSNAFSSDPTASPSAQGPPRPRNNPALAIMAARKRIEDEAEEDKSAMGKPGFQGRRYVDIHTVKKALMLRDEQGVAPPEVERILGLRKGAVSMLGGVGVVEAA